MNAFKISLIAFFFIEIATIIIFEIYQRMIGLNSEKKKQVSRFVQKLLGIGLAIIFSIELSSLGTGIVYAVTISLLFVFHVVGICVVLRSRRI